MPPVERASANKFERVSGFLLYVNVDNKKQEKNRLEECLRVYGLIFCFVLGGRRITHAKEV